MLFQNLGNMHLDEAQETSVDKKQDVTDNLSICVLNLLQ